MRDELLKNSDKLGPGSYENLAKVIGLDTSGFAACYGSAEAEEAVNQDVAEAHASGITGTPTFVVGRLTAEGKLKGELVVGASPLDEFDTLLATLLTEPEAKP